MSESEHPVARRTLMKGAGLSIGTGLLGLAPARAQPAAAGDIWSAEYWAKKGEVSLHIWRKRVGAPRPGDALPVLFLVHGSSVSARPSFDLAVPGRDHSAMDWFARAGFDVWTMDHENYGRSSRTAGNSDIASGVEDLKAAVEVVTRETGRPKMHVAGTSSGALRAGAFATARPDRIDRLILIAFTYKGEGSPTLAKRAEQLAYYRTHNMRLRDRAMVRSIFTRDKAGTTDQAVVEALADAELAFGDQVPTGTYLDMTSNLPVVDPKKVLSPVLLLRGQHDGIASLDDLFAFYNDLPNGDRQFVMLPGAAHSLMHAANRQMAFHVMRSFLTMPPAVVT